ncbi:porin [Acerihabitans arboris]|uniref:Porin OmpC n=1 Tax=Acerihabitans arboris TaxID=2691583 RepID=A0A845SQP4_9GAMM|nr:porin [Acerihabitans arboris]NDL65254.1 porin OmpC [Acerihabitans arboris]
MKLCLNYALMPVLVFTGAAGAVEIYNKDGHKLDLNGTLAGVHYFKNNNVDTDQSYMRFGFLGETQVTNQLTGYAQWQYQALLDQDEKDESRDMTTRLGFIGLKFGDYGSFDYGRNWGVLYDVLSWTDRLPEFGGDAFGADDYLSQRANNLATYRNAGFFGLVEGLDVALQYQGANAAGEKKGKGRGLSAANGNGYGMSATYDLGHGISAAGAFSSASRTGGQKKLEYGRGGDKVNAYSGALKYDAQNLYLAVMYTQSYNLARFGDFEDDGKISGFAHKAQTLEVVAQYMFDFGLTPSLAYLQTTGVDIEKYGRQPLRKYVDVGATYSFNKNLAAHVDYQINLLDGNEFSERADIKRNNIVAVGMVYQF